MNYEWLNISLEEFHFLRPIFLWLLIPSIIAMVLGLLNMNKQSRWQHHIAPHLRPFVIKKGSEKKIRRLRLFTVFIISLAVLGLAGPTWKKIRVPGKMQETPLVILLDLSQSMMAEDIQPNRLERAKFKVHDLLKANPHARTALIAFAGTAHTVVPLTSDYTIISKHLDGLTPDIMPVAGSNIQAALQLSDTITQSIEATSRIILFTDDFTDEVFNDVRNFANVGNTLVEIMPMNTTGGSAIPRPGSNAPFKDKDGNIVHSSLNEDVLNKLHALDNVNVNALTLDNSDVKLIAKSVGDKLKFQEEEQEKEDEWEDRGLWFIIPFAFLVLFWFRRGWVIFSMFAMLSMSSCSSDTSFNDLWLTKDYQAQLEYNKGHYGEAALLYTDPMHRGVAWYKAGEYEKAIQAFKADTTAHGAYNLGLAYYKSGDYSSAALAFGTASELDPGLDDAQQNKDLMLQLAAEEDVSTPMEAEEAGDGKQAQNIENKDQEDLGGGGQEATEKDMEKERKEETVETGQRKGKEMEDVPEDFESGKTESMQKIVMQKVDDDPALFLKRKFRYQLKKGIVVKPDKDDNEW